MGKIIALTGCKGGCGTTTLTAAFGREIAALSHKVCLVDMNVGMRGLDLALNAQDRVVFDLYDLCAEACAMEQVLIQIRDTLWFIAAPQLADAGDMPAKKILHVLDRLKKRFDYVFLDMPVCGNSFTQTFAAAVDQLILITIPGSLAARNTEHGCALLRDAGAASLFMAANLCNDRKPQSKLSAFTALTQYLDVPLIGAIPESSALHESGLGIGSVTGTYSGTARAAVHETALRICGENLPLTEKKNWRLPWHF